MNATEVKHQHQINSLVTPEEVGRFQRVIWSTEATPKGREIVIRELNGLRKLVVRTTPRTYRFAIAHPAIESRDSIRFEWLTSKPMPKGVAMDYSLDGRIESLMLRVITNARE